MDGDEFTSPHAASSQAEEDVTRSIATKQRRSRVSLACQRCKHRKQKVNTHCTLKHTQLTKDQCNGDQPSCARCAKLFLDCHYVMPIYPKAGQAKLYIKALEDRVAELEMILDSGGNRTVSRDHWTEKSDHDDDSDSGNIQPLLNAVRDLSLDVAGSYVGGASTITLGRALETALAGKTQLIPPYMGGLGGKTMRQQSIASECSSSAGGTNTFHPHQIDSATADKVVHAYINHLYANFPIMYSYDILALHGRRHCLRDVYEESILNLIYGLGGHFLDKVRRNVPSL
jgi:hypothetical protein